MEITPRPVKEIAAFLYEDFQSISFYCANLHLAWVLDCVIVQDEVVNSMSLSLCSCYVCVIVIHHKLADAQFFMADAQFFGVGAQFFAVGLL